MSKTKLTAISISDGKIDLPEKTKTSHVDAVLFASLWQQVRKLPQREQEALEAYARVSGESCRAVAKRYGVSPQAVCNWAEKACQKLSQVEELQ